MNGPPDLGFHQISSEFVEKIHDLLKQKEENWFKDRTNLRQDIARLTISSHRHEEVMERMRCKLTRRNSDIALERAHKILGTRHVLNHWRAITFDRDKDNVILNISKRYQNFKFRKAVFGVWRLESTRTIVARVRNKYEMKLETMTAGIITRYEEELVRLRSEVLSAQETVAREKIQRQQLEEHMRRTLLQSMTAMNVKTMQLLNQGFRQDPDE